MRGCPLTHETAVDFKLNKFIVAARVWIVQRDGQCSQHLLQRKTPKCPQDRTIPEWPGIRKQCRRTDSFFASGGAAHFTLTKEKGFSRTIRQSERRRI